MIRSARFFSFTPSSRHLRRPIPTTLLPFASADISTATTATSTAFCALSTTAHQSGQDPFHHSSSRVGQVFVVAAAASVAAAATIVVSDNNITWCESNPSRQGDSPDDKDTQPVQRDSDIFNDNDNDDDEEEEDPYDNLPEKDEPTHCSICLTYRQGPCRPYWRKVEACTKDHELPSKQDQDNNDNDNDNNNSDDNQYTDPPCLKYMLPWIECASGFRNLYALIELDTNYTMGIADLEKDATFMACWLPNHSRQPDIDWTPWEAYMAEHAQTYKQHQVEATATATATTAAGTVTPKTSLWKTLGTQQDPQLIEIQAKVPATQLYKSSSSSSSSSTGILECAYAVDQNGNVLGFAYGTKPSEAIAASTTKESTTSDKDNDTNEPQPEQQQQDDSVEMVELKIRLSPTHTRTVAVAAAYTHPPNTTTDSSSEPESHIFKTRPFDLAEMGTEQPQQ